MDVSDDEAVREGLHSIAEDVAADGLDDILHELRSVGFDAFPLLSRAYTFIGDGFSTELVCANPGLHICKPDQLYPLMPDRMKVDGFITNIPFTILTMWMEEKEAIRSEGQ